MLRTTWNTPDLSRSHKVKALRSASSKKREQTALEQLDSGAALTRRELLPAPLICSFTLKLQPVLLPAAWEVESAFKTTARRKFFCVNSSSGLPSPSMSAA